MPPHLPPDLRRPDCIISPFLRIVRATPVASFTILALVWINNDWLPVFISFLMVVPIVWSNLESGIKQIDVQLLEMAKVYRLGFLKTLIFVRIPSVMPYFMAACATAMGFSWKSGIAAEVISRPPGCQSAGSFTTQKSILKPPAFLHGQ